ncbi:MAG: AEC family transporter [Spirochaetes bacterium]|nr:AEC family transporter [Spirochaetota bacterium]
MILTTIVPIFFIILLGFILKSFKLVPDDWISVLNKFGLYVAFPALILHSLISTDRSVPINTWVIVINFAMLLFIILSVYFLTRLFKLKKSMINTYTICIFFGNIGYLGYPFISSVYPGSESIISMNIAIYNVLLFTLGIFILEVSIGHKVHTRTLLMNIIKNPLLIAVILGLLLLIIGFKPPVFIKKSISMLAHSASPVVLFSLGIFVARKISFKKKFAHTTLLVVFRLLIVPLLFFIVYRIFSPGPGFRVSILESAMPLALTPFALAEKYPMEKNIIANAIIISTVLSALSLTFIVYIIGK